MKITVVPAQVTTVEDRITANLSISQLILLAIPMFFGALLYWVLPPAMDFSLYKLIIISALTVVCIVLSIRIRGKITLLWLVLILRYNMRPKLYLLDKRTTVAREDYPDTPVSSDYSKNTLEKLDHAGALRLGNRESAYVYTALNDPMSRLNFETNKKGVINVRITEVQEQI
jgi:hypothetical protein